MAREVTVYETEDGKLFENIKDAEAYEEERGRNRVVDAFISSKWGAGSRFGRGFRANLEEFLSFEEKWNQEHADNGTVDTTTEAPSEDTQQVNTEQPAASDVDADNGPVDQDTK